MLAAFEDVLDRLNVASRNGERAMSFCPAHEDRANTLLHAVGTSHAVHVSQSIPSGMRALCSTTAMGVPSVRRQERRRLLKERWVSATGGCE